MLSSPLLSGPGFSFCSLLLLISKGFSSKNKIKWSQLLNNCPAFNDPLIPLSIPTVHFQAPSFPSPSKSHLPRHHPSNFPPPSEPPPPVASHHSIKPSPPSLKRLPSLSPPLPCYSSRASTPNRQSPPRLPRRHPL